MCVNNNGTTTKYFSLGRGTHQGDPILAFSLVLALEVIFLLTESKPEFEGMTIFDYNYLYSTYADDTTFFLKYIISIKYMVDTFDFFFSYLSRVKPNLRKSEIAGIGVLMGV